MLVTIKILELSGPILSENTEIYYKVNDEDKKVADKEFDFRIKTMHDYYFNWLRITFKDLAKKYQGSGVYADIRFRDFKENTLDEFSSAIILAPEEEEYRFYHFSRKKKVGNILLQYKTTDKNFDRCLHVGKEPTFIDRVFNFFSNNDKQIKISVILNKAFEITKGSIKSKFDFF